MRNIIVVFLSVLFGLSCSERKTLSNDRHIPILDFSALEPLLLRDNDTVYVYNFWATWCAPCVKEFPIFERAAKFYASKPVKFLMVSLDFPVGIDNSLIPFLDGRNSELDVVLLDDPDQNTWINKVNPQWSGALPATLIRRGNNTIFIEGTVDIEELTQSINKIIINPKTK